MRKAPVNARARCEKRRVGDKRCCLRSGTNVDPGNFVELHQRLPFSTAVRIFRLFELRVSRKAERSTTDRTHRWKEGEVTEAKWLYSHLDKIRKERDPQRAVCYARKWSRRSSNDQRVERKKERKREKESTQLLSVYQEGNGNLPDGPAINTQMNCGETRLTSTHQTLRRLLFLS